MDSTLLLGGLPSAGAVEMSQSPEQHWEQAFRELSPRLVMFFHGRGFAEGEAMAQECVLRALQRMRAGVEIQNVGAYLQGIAENLVLETQRTEARQRQVRVLIAEPDHRCEQRAKELDAAKRILSRKDRIILDRYHAGLRGRMRTLKRKDLASDLDASSNSLRIRICRILKLLRIEIRRLTGETINE